MNDFFNAVNEALWYAIALYGFFAFLGWLRRRLNVKLGKWLVNSVLAFPYIFSLLCAGWYGFAMAVRLERYRDERITVIFLFVVFVVGMYCCRFIRDRFVEPTDRQNDRIYRR